MAFEEGETNSYGLENAQERGELFMEVGVPVYRGMIVGEHSHPGDLVINVCKKKQLSNVRSSTADIATRLTPPRLMSLEQCLALIADDELVEVIPRSLRMRKQSLI